MLDAYGSGYLSDLAEGIDWCIKNGIQVINLSVQVKTNYPLLKDAVERALDAGLIIVSSAGNTYGRSTAYPAAYQGVIFVNAIDENDNTADCSAVGKVDFCALGIDVYSTYLDNGYLNLSRTSMAAAHVTGIFGFN